MQKILVSDGELIDKFIILKIKKKFIKNKEKLKNINKEFVYLKKIINKNFNKNRKEYSKLINKLQNINIKLWKIEDAIREKEKYKQFDSDFIFIARSVYTLNDLRFEIKNKINELNKTSFKEEKGYKKYN